MSSAPKEHLVLLLGSSQHPWRRQDALRWFGRERLTHDKGLRPSAYRLVALLMFVSVHVLR